jgi:uncharacterized protein YndB with AHSA1/START domain
LPSRKGGRIPHPPEKIWRALTQAHLIEQWLMKNDFEPRLGAQFTFRAKPMRDWNGIVRCEVTALEGRIGKQSRLRRRA